MPRRNGATSPGAAHNKRINLAKDNFIFYRQWWESIRELAPEQQSCAYDALMPFAFDGIEPTDPVIRAITSPMRTTVQRDSERYDRVCAARREAGRKGGRPPKKQKANESKQNQTKPIGFSESESTAPASPEPTAPTMTDIETQFEQFRQSYPGTKRGFKTEWDNFKKKNPKTYRDIVPLLTPALQRLMEWRERAQTAGQFVPNFKNLTTWLNKQCWTEELPEINVPPTHAAPNTPTTPTPRNYDSDDDFGAAKY